MYSNPWVLRRNKHLPYVMGAQQPMVPVIVHPCVVVMSCTCARNVRSRPRACSCCLYRQQKGKGVVSTIEGIWSTVIAQKKYLKILLLLLLFAFYSTLDFVCFLFDFWFCCCWLGFVCFGLLVCFRFVLGFVFCWVFFFFLGGGGGGGGRVTWQLINDKLKGWMNEDVKKRMNG